MKIFLKVTHQMSVSAEKDKLQNGRKFYKLCICCVINIQNRKFLKFNRTGTILQRR